MRLQEHKYIILGSLCALIVTMTVAYAAFQSVLKIKGTSNISSNWDILITNVEETNKGGQAITTEKEGVTNPNWDGLTANIEADLFQKGDYIEYEVTVENRGTLDAKLNEIKTNTTKENEAILISFSGYTKGEKLEKGTSHKIIVRIEYNPEFNGIPEIGSKEVNIELEYTQNDDYKKEENGEITSPDRYLVTYDCTTNGGEKCTNYNEYLKEGETINLTHKGPNKKYDFIGWNTDKDAKEGLSELQMNTEEITLYAIYQGDPIIKSWTSSDTTDFHSAAYKESIISAEFLDHKNVPENAIESWDVSAAGDKSVMAWVIADETDNTKHHLYVGGKDGVIANEDSSSLFSEFTNIQTINFGKNFDTSNVTSIYAMFAHMSKLTSIDLSSFDTRNLVNMQDVFANCTSLTEIDLSSFDTRKVTNMQGLFWKASELKKINVSTFDTSNVTKMYGIFYNNEKLTKLNLCSWNTNNVTDMGHIFYGTTGLTKIYVSSNWTTTNANTYQMFVGSGTSSVSQSNNCEADAEDPATIELATSTTTSTITVVVDAKAASGIEKYEYQIDGGQWIESTENIYTFTGLESNTEHQIKIRVTSKVGKQTTASTGVPLDSMIMWVQSNNPNNTDTVLADKSGKGNNGILHGFNNTKTSGYNNGNLEFDGIDDYVDFRLANYNFNNSVTYVAYVAINGPSDDDDIIGNWESAGGGLLLYNNKISYNVYSSGEGYKEAYDNKEYELGRYYSIIGTYDGTNVKLYIDGVLISEVPAKNLTTSPMPIYMGANAGVNNAVGGFANISVKEAMIYDKALTEEEVKKLTNKFNKKTNTTTKTINPPTFEENEKEVTIIYPEGCGDTLTCSYQKDEGDWIETQDTNTKITFTESGNVVAKVSDGTNEVTSSYTVIFEGNNLEYKGEVQTFTADKDGYYKIELWGAQGGGPRGANGAYTSGEIYLTAGTNLYVYIGQYNNVINGTTFNGGAGTGGYPGGGATDIRLISGDWRNANSLRSRIMVAAGGGAGGDSGADTGYPGIGGMLIGNSGEVATGGKQTTGGTQQNSYGNGGFGTAGSGCGGGSGYYGGGGALCANGAGGGSSYISGYAGVNSITSETDETHTSQTKHYSNRYFINTEMQSGINSGNGKAKITYLKTPSSKDSTKIKGVRYVKDCINGSSANSSNHWVELQAINKGINVAKGKTVTGTHPEYSSYPYSRIVDGKADETSQYGEPTTGGVIQCVTVDLEKEYDLEEIAVWHYYGDGRTYKNNTISVAGEDKDYKILTLENTPETSNGLHIKSAKSKGFHTSGSCTYYIDNGKLATKWLDLGADKLYYFDNEGCMKKSAWINDEYTDNTGISCSSKWYYASSDGKMHTGWLHLGEYWYYLAKKDGKENAWQSAQPRGCMMTGWVYSEDYACDTHGWYFNPPPAGNMVSNTTIDGYTINAGGCWVR